MACISRRRNRWVVDYRDHTGARRWRSFTTKGQAELALADVLRESGHATTPVVDPRITVGRYADEWLGRVAPRLKFATVRSYRGVLNGLPVTLKTLRVRSLTKGHLRAHLEGKLGKGLSRNTVRIIHACLRTMLNAAVDDGLIVRNPAERLGRTLKLATPTSVSEEPGALTAEHLAAFLKAAAGVSPLYHPFFYVMSRSGMRRGEASALRWDDIDVVSGRIRVARSFSGGRLGTTKSGRSRGVDISTAVVEFLKRRDAARKAAALEAGREPCVLVFPGRDGQMLDQSRVCKVFKRVLKAAGLPPHLTPHCLRCVFR